MGGAPCPLEIMKRVVSEMHMPEVTIAYGMTETSPCLTFTRVDDSLERRVTTVGRVFPHVEVKIVDPVTGAVVPRGDVRRAVRARLQRDARLLGEPRPATDAAIDSARWMHTGDLATDGRTGTSTSSGGSRTLIIRGGENISPREVEEYLYTHLHSPRTQVIGVPSGRYGEEVMAWIQLRDGTAPIPATISGVLSRRIATFKIPRSGSASTASR